MRTYLKETIKPLIPITVRNAIIAVTKYSTICDTTGTTVNDAASTEDVWIPSLRELQGSSSTIATETQGPVYDRIFSHSSGSSSESWLKKKISESSPSDWWTRSSVGNYGFRYILNAGTYGNLASSNSRSLALGFCTNEENPIKEINDTFANVVTAIHSGTHNYKVGNYVEIDMGTFGTGYAQIVGFDKDDKADGTGKAKCTWVLKNQLTTTHAMNSSEKTVDGVTAYTAGGYLNTDMRAWINGTVEPQFESSVQNAIVPVTKTHSTWNGTAYVKNGQTTTERMFLLSNYEVFGTTTYEDQGPNYTQLFKDAASRIKTRSVSAEVWWLRSAYSNRGFQFVSGSGDASGLSAGNACGVILGFCTD